LCYTIATRLALPSFLHDALPIYFRRLAGNPSYYGLNDSSPDAVAGFLRDLITRVVRELQDAKCVAIDDQSSTAISFAATEVGDIDRKSTRLNSSHVKNSYAVFCL